MTEILGWFTLGVLIFTAADVACYMAVPYELKTWAWWRYAPGSGYVFLLLYKTGSLGDIQQHSE